MFKRLFVMFTITLPIIFLLTGCTVPSEGIPGPQGPEGPPGPSGPQGEPGECEISRAEFDALLARVTALEAQNGCTDGDECDPDDYCSKEVGDCDGLGSCMPRPEMCPDVWDPVCGCDGETYDNECVAANAGINVAHSGGCITSCNNNGDCDPGYYCSKEVGDCDGLGTCMPRPEACPLVWDPVCGCDGETYDNECVAANAGINVAHEGECP